jgi:hypothetical protein
MSLLYYLLLRGRAMAQAVSRRLSLTAEIPVRARVRFVVDRLALGQVFVRVFSFPLSLSLNWGSMHMHHLGMDNRPVGGRRSKIQSCSIDMNSRQHTCCVLKVNRVSFHYLSNRSTDNLNLLFLIPVGCC